MVRTAARLRAEGLSVAVVDLTSLGQNVTSEQWYGGLIARIGEQLRIEDVLEDFWDSNQQLGPLARFLKTLREVLLASIDGSVVIFVDEIDCVRIFRFRRMNFLQVFDNYITREPRIPNFGVCLLPAWCCDTFRFDSRRSYDAFQYRHTH